MSKLKIENYICFSEKTVKFDELNDDEKDEFRMHMMKILQKQTNLEYKENSEENTNKIVEDGENIPKTISE